MSIQALRHNCGLCVAKTLHDAYSFIRSLQHRGREAAGIAAIGSDQIVVIKWLGPVTRFDITDLHKILPAPLFHTYFAHVRYATRGRKETREILCDAHPIAIGGKVTHEQDHIIIRDCEAVIIHNGQVDIPFSELPTGTKLKTGTDTEALLYYLLANGPRTALHEIPGAYTLAYTLRRFPEIIAMRDRTGIKPGVLGWKDGSYGFASEDIAFRKNGGEFTEDMEPGTIYYLRSNGSYRKEPVVTPETRFCFFEWNYLADVDSMLNGINVRLLREQLGAALPYIPVDLVTCVPRCPQVAARVYAKNKGLPFSSVLYKTRGERSFQGSTAKQRHDSIASNLFLLPYLRGPGGEVIAAPDFLAGKKVTLIDDSIVRGNNSVHARDLLLGQAKVAEINFLSYTPPIGIVGDDGIPRGCLFGVDMPPRDKFIARERTRAEISSKMGMDVHHLSLERMLAVYRRCGLHPEQLCTYCVGGPHPFGNT